MQLHEVKHLKEVGFASDAEAAIADGWSLVAVIPNPFAGNGFGMAVYVLGKKAENWAERAVSGAQGNVLEPRQ